MTNYSNEKRAAELLCIGDNLVTLAKSVELDASEASPDLVAALDRFERDYAKLCEAVRASDDLKRWAEPWMPDVDAAVRDQYLDWAAEL